MLFPWALNANPFRIESPKYDSLVNGIRDFKDFMNEIVKVSTLFYPFSSKQIVNKLHQKLDKVVS